MGCYVGLEHLARQRGDKGQAVPSGRHRAGLAVITNERVSPRTKNAELHQRLFASRRGMRVTIQHRQIKGDILPV